jgi:hypothetical protein
MDTNLGQVGYDTIQEVHTLCPFGNESHIS